MLKSDDHSGVLGLRDCGASATGFVLHYFDGDKAISLADHCLEIARLLGMISQDLADLADRRVDPLLDVDKNISTPQFFLDFTPADELASPVYQQYQQLQWEIFQLYSRSATLQLVTIDIQREFPESEHSWQHLFPTSERNRDRWEQP
ncbi:MAG TPA: hypothetical protein VEK84_11020 [Terriglobales bacterium]|nr:hypothetical protein [Terriglobales bacterium]